MMFAHKLYKKQNSLKINKKIALFFILMFKKKKKKFLGFTSLGLPTYS